MLTNVHPALLNPIEYSSIINVYVFKDGMREMDYAKVFYTYKFRL